MTSLYAATLLGSSVYVLLWSFLAYSFVGVVVEGLFFLACARSLESRSGLLFLPLRPLYGFGGCAFVLLLRPVVAQPVAVFVLGAVVATVVEYLARVTVLGAQSAGAGDAAAGTGWVRLVDRLVPDRVLINSFPWMTLVDELVRLTGQQRVWIRLPGGRGAG
jgi:hypothetical protein